jgi:hypothetical protein
VELRLSIRRLKGLLRVAGRGGLAVAALWLGQATQTCTATPISQLDAIRDRLRMHDQVWAQQLKGVDTMLGIASGNIKADLGDGVVAQWFNWGNWANWNNWNNWGNWRNF